MTNVPNAYREADVRGATAVRLVVLLYEQIIRDLTQAAQAIEQNDIESRTKFINHAILVVAYLQSPLDFGNGGKVAKDLDTFYNALRQQMMQVQFFPTKAGMNQLITDVLAVREAWIEVQRAETALVTRVAISPDSSVDASNSTGSRTDISPVRTKWQG
jgi:flagellar biosynthetic protein FliS